MIPIAIEVKTPGQVAEVAQKLLSLAGARRKFALTGDLGSGKTTLIKALCAALGVQGQVSSPSFSIVNEQTTNLNLAYWVLGEIKDGPTWKPGMQNGEAVAVVQEISFKY